MMEPAETQKTSATERAIFSVAEMQTAEDQIFSQGVSVFDLMTIAGQGAAELIWRIGGDTPTIILCGPGNNGGDGFIIAEYLRQKGMDVAVAILGQSRSDAATKARMAYRGKISSLEEAKGRPQIVEALFGTGQTRPLDDEIYRHTKRLLAQTNRSFTLDVPAGVECDTGALYNELRHFDHCITLGAYKNAHFQGDARSICGKVSLVPIGIECPVDAAKTLIQPVLKVPDFTSHKYRRGKLVVVAGPMPGAAILSATAALRAGAGHVSIVSRYPPVNGLLPDIIWRHAKTDQELENWLSDRRNDIVLIGPGLGRDSDAQKLISYAINASAGRLVIDADALHLLNADTIKKLAANTVLTPHDGEFSIMEKQLNLKPSSNRIADTRRFAKKINATVVRKGSTTIIAQGHEQCVISNNGSSWLSVAGSGDVLAGIIGARLAGASDECSFKGVCEAQFLQEYASHLLPGPFTASDLVATLSSAVCDVTNRNRNRNG